MSNIFEEIDIKSLPDNIFHLLDEEWMLITAGTKESFNTMTASWGSFGILWERPIAIAFIRPQRYTIKFVENSMFFTMSFFTPIYKQILNFCGQYSGKNVNKIKETGLIPVYTPSGNITYEQARLVIECRKIYSDQIKSEKFIDKQIIQRIYPTQDFHKMFIGEITHAYIINAQK